MIQRRPRFACRQTLRQAGLLGCIVLVLSGCSGESQQAVDVGVTIPPQRFLVERLLGDTASVMVAVPPGASPATHQPSDATVAALHGATLFIRLGVPMERGSWLTGLQRSTTVIDGTEGVQLREMEAHDHGHDHDHDHHHHHHHADAKDPHIWLDPIILLHHAEIMSAALKQAFPERQSTIEANHAALSAELQALQTELAEVLAPYAGRRFFVYHPAWGYFADRYGLGQVALEVGGREPSDAQLASLRQQAEADNVQVLLVQPQIHGGSARKLADAIGAELVTADPLVEDVIGNLRSTAALLVASWRQADAAGESAHESPTAP